MDALTLRASLVSQRDAAQWYASARNCTEKASEAPTEYGAGLLLRAAISDQRIAADLALADRTFRGLE
jgi:hypothetical protein